MCGIAGIVALAPGARPPQWAALARMTRVLRHRGPDDEGIELSGRTGIAHTRLAIIDANGGHQPMKSDDGTLVISYNGEVFNYIELRAELEAIGRRFRTRSDTEVVLAAYAAWGEDAFVRFNGQFAIAIWDSLANRLVLARDRLGVHPIYVCRHGGRVYFASEIKAIFAADSAISRELDPSGLDDTFTFWTPVAPATVFRGVEEIPAGHLRVYDASGERERAFWSPSYPADFRGTVDDAADAVGDALEQATRLRVVRADVPVGAYLSGGLDSSLVAALAQRATRGRLATFSLRFDVPELDEGVYQRIVAERLESDHHEIIVRKSDIARVFPSVVAHAERPLLRTAPAPLMLLASLVADAGIKVVLTGEGADEMFGGYDLFREAKVRRFWARQPSSTTRPRLLERLYPYLTRSPVGGTGMAHAFFRDGLDTVEAFDFAHDTRWRTTSALKRLFSDDLKGLLGTRDARAEIARTLPADFRSLAPLARDQLLEIKTLLSGYLLAAQGDRMLMSRSIEGRFPFLDADVVTLANALPDTYKLHVLDEKHVVKRAAVRLVPETVLRRPKQPYRAPDAISFVGEAAPEWVDAMLEPSAVARAGVFDPIAVGRLRAKCRAAAASGSLSNFDNMALVGVLSTQLLFHSFVDGFSIPEVRP